MIKRIRDKVRQFRPQEVISYQDWQEIDRRATEASMFLSKDSLLMKSLRSNLKDAEDMVLTNRVKEVREVRLFGDMQKIFIHTKEEQMNELVGQIKCIRNLIAELESWVESKAELERLEADGKIAIRKRPEE